ncbi:Dynein light chain Tctex-type [Clonorchis sinensis]|uniref:Dynein light chain Tctex-type n=1 Tax=Clonorchis sinensis TaxID=79923 RepID=A0A8T1MVH9_CLOSI|nr:Dynein light chain Tctex-type [Clonorchis sinensis]
MTMKPAQAVEVLHSGTPAAMQFSVEEVEPLVRKSIETVLSQQSYVHDQTQQWARTIIEGCLDKLVKLSKPYKYIVNCTLAQKNGGGLYNASSCYWDNTKDDTCTVKWENRTIACIVTVFGVGF